MSYRGFTGSMPGANARPWIVEHCGRRRDLKSLGASDKALDALETFSMEMAYVTPCTTRDYFVAGLR